MPIGWLSHDPLLSSTIEGVYVDRAGTKTRVEEYTFVRDTAEYLRGYRAIDAATGYVDKWHMLPYILANLGWQVRTFDIDPRTMDMPYDPNVERQVASLSSMPYEDASCDLLTCISTLEHVSPEVREAFAAEAARVVSPGGTIVLTADNYEGISPEYLASLISQYFEVDPDVRSNDDHPFPGGKRVAYVVGRRRVEATLSGDPSIPGS